MSEFIPGLALSERLYRDAVAPLLANDFPTLPHAAALIGRGSEVLGFDTQRSTDHDWGPRLQLFLPVSRMGQAADVSAMLSAQLPTELLGHPTNLVTDAVTGTRNMAPASGPVQHGIDVLDVATWSVTNLGFVPTDPITADQWLSTPTQNLAAATAGSVFADSFGELTDVRRRLRWYPADVWRHVLASQWQRIAEEEPFVGRCREVGDELGSAVVAARLVRDLMRLALLQDQRYPPYGKWLGSAFARLPDASAIVPTMTAVVTTRDPHRRESALVAASEWVAHRANRLPLASFVDPTPRTFHDRPFVVIGADRFAAALRAAIDDPALRERPLVGSVDQWVDSTAAAGQLDRLGRAQQAWT